MPVLECVLLGAMALSFSCSALVGGMLFGVNGLLLLRITASTEFKYGGVDALRVMAL